MLLKLSRVFQPWDVWADQTDKQKRKKPRDGHYLDNMNISMWDWFLICDY